MKGMHTHQSTSEVRKCFHFVFSQRRAAVFQASRTKTVHHQRVCSQNNHKCNAVESMWSAIARSTAAGTNAELVVVVTNHREQPETVCWVEWQMHIFR